MEMEFELLSHSDCVRKHWMPVHRCTLPCQGKVAAGRCWSREVLTGMLDQSGAALLPLQCQLVITPCCGQVVNACPQHGLYHPYMSNQRLEQTNSFKMARVSQFQWYN